MIRQLKQPFPARLLFPDALFRVPGTGKKLFLTFDDGPDPDSTPQILEVLSKFNVTATFFCTGSKVVENPGLFARIAAGGHAIGNHGYTHLNGASSSVKGYCADVFRGRDITCSRLFRPPYGRIRLRQYKILERSMRIVFWDIMPYDFDLRLTPDSSLEILTRRIRPGSIIVLHDTPQSHARHFLERFLVYAIDMGYSFLPVDDSIIHGG